MLVLDGRQYRTTRLSVSSEMSTNGQDLSLNHGKNCENSGIRDGEINGKMENNNVPVEKVAQHEQSNGHRETCNGSEHSSTTNGISKPPTETSANKIAAGKGSPKKSASKKFFR